MYGGDGLGDTWQSNEHMVKGDGFEEGLKERIYEKKSHLQTFLPVSSSLSLPPPATTRPLVVPFFPLTLVHVLFLSFSCLKSKP